MRFYTLRVLQLSLCMLVAFGTQAKEFDHDYIKKHLQTTVYPIDSNADAITLYEDIGTEISFENTVFTKKKVVHKLIKILHTDALDLANVHVAYRHKDYRNFITRITGTTYNLVNGEIVTADLDGKDLLKKSVGKDLHTMNFSMPSVKEGSIIEYTYEVQSSHGQPLFVWDVQEKYPKLESAYHLTYPRDFEFTSISHLRATQKDYRYEAEAEKGNDELAYVKNSSSEGQRTFWIRRNIQGMASEPFVVNEENQIERLEMQITGVGTGINTVHFNNTWEKMNQQIWKGDGLRRELNGAYDFFDAAIDSLKKNNPNPYALTKAIYKYVRGNFKSDYSSTPVDKLNIRKAYEAAVLSKDEINGILIAMLLRADIVASPIILSTTDDVSPNEFVPVLDRMEYMACAVQDSTGYLLLDASNKNNCIGMLPPECYNGFSWILGDKGKGIKLTPSLIKDKNVCTVRIFDFTDSTAKMEVTRKLGLVTSAQKRKTWTVDKKSQKAELAQAKLGIPEDFEMIESHVYNEQNPDTNLVIKYTCKMNFAKGTSSFYINSHFAKLYENNPLKAGERKMPIEFPNQSEYSYYMTIVMPPTLVPDTLGQPMLIDYENGSMTYKRLAGYFPEMHTLTINSTYTVNGTSYDTEAYASIREFFQKMIDDNNQVLVLKRGGN